MNIIEIKDTDQFGKVAAESVKWLKARCDYSSDIISNDCEVGGRKACVVNCDGMIDTQTLSISVLTKLESIPAGMSDKDLLENISSKTLISVDQLTFDDISEATKLVMAGFALVFIDGITKGLAVGVQGFKSRPVGEANMNMDLRSSKESFNEVIRVNIAQLRRRMKSPDLVFRMMNAGKVSRTDVCLAYVKGKCAQELVDEVSRRIDSLEMDVILEGGYIQPFLECRTNVLFTECGTTERPDVLLAKLYEGRIAVLVDGTPFVIYLPKLFSENFQTMDDYTGQSIYASVMRLMKWVAFYVSILLPGAYIAIANFHPYLFPNRLLFTIMSSIRGTPYPLLAECLIIHVMYEIMREAGLRLPSYIGHAVSIVGGLVIGQIVVSAHFVGAPMVLVIAVSVICGFVVPDLNATGVILRSLFILAGGLFGVFGMILAGFALSIKIMSMDCYGTPITAPVSPFSFSGMRDTFFRTGWRKLSKDPVALKELQGVNFNESEDPNG